MSLVFVRPERIEDAISELGEEGSHVFAGGQSLVLFMNTGLMYPEKLVSLQRVPGLDQVTLGDATIHLGAMCTHQQLAEDEVLAARLPAATRMFRSIGNIRVRSAGTLGGNIVHADPAQDPPVLLTALDAAVTLVGPDGERRISMADVSDGAFSTVLEPSEILTGVDVPLPQGDVRSTHVKFLSGTKDDYATVCVGARVELDDRGTVRDVRLAAGAIGAAVVELHEPGRLLVDHELDDEDALRAVADAVREAVSPFPDRRGSADYKRHMAGVVAARALRGCGQPSTPGGSQANEHGRGS